jgi:glycosyltransferase involved in cell wall biosynthesis
MPTADLSVVMANRNHARVLPRALDAVLSQSTQPSEVIILDDDSSDDSIRILEGYCSRNSIVRLIRNESRLGVTATYNRGFALATGRYLLHIAADDYLLPGFIAKAIGQFRLHPRAGVCVANGSCTEGDRGPLIENDPGWCERPTYFSPEELCCRLWHTLPVSALIIRRDAAMAAGGFLPQLAWYSDWFMDLVVAFRHGVIHLPETLGIHVVHPSSYSASARSGPEHICVLGALLDCLTSPGYADVAPYFRRNGAMCHFGPDLFRAAALRTDRFEPAVLGLLAGFAPGVYKQIAQDDDPAVRQLAAVFLQDPWRELIARRGDLEAENRRLVEEIQLARLRAAPTGTIGKLRWAARLVRRRLRKAVGLHPAGPFR